MSFELPPTCRAKSDKVFSGNALTILATLISPLLAVCLAQCLRVQEKHHTTFALPVQEPPPASKPLRIQRLAWNPPTLRQEITSNPGKPLLPNRKSKPWPGS